MRRHGEEFAACTTPRDGPRWSNSRTRPTSAFAASAARRSKRSSRWTRALTAIATDPDSVVPREDVDVCCEAPDDELLFAEWLNRLVYEMATRSVVFRRFRVRFDGPALVATASGEPVDGARHRPAVEPKGATYTALRVACEQGRWIAQTVVDVHMKHHPTLAALAALQRACQRLGAARRR